MMTSHFRTLLTADCCTWAMRYSSRFYFYFYHNTLLSFSNPSIFLEIVHVYTAWHSEGRNMSNWLELFSLRFDCYHLVLVIRCYATPELTGWQTNHLALRLTNISFFHFFLWNKTFHLFLFAGSWFLLHFVYNFFDKFVACLRHSRNFIFLFVHFQGGILLHLFNICFC